MSRIAALFTMARFTDAASAIGLADRWRTARGLPSLVEARRREIQILAGGHVHLEEKPDPCLGVPSLEERLRMCRRIMELPVSLGVTLAGAGNLEAARRDRNEGVLLWVANFSGQTDASKIALWQAGHLSYHLSLPDHGIATHRGASRVNRRWQQVERHFLADRVVMEPSNPAPALKALHAHLRAGDVVSVTDVFNTAQPISVPFLGGWRLVSPGAARLAAAAEAPICPVFTLRLGATRYVVEIGAPIRPDPGLPLKVRSEKMLQAYIRALEEKVRDHPLLWQSWQRYRPAADLQVPAAIEARPERVALRHLGVTESSRRGWSGTG